MRRVVVLLAAVLALVAACGGEKRPESPSGGSSGSVVAKPSFEEKDASSVTKVTVTEFAFQLPPTVKGPKVFLEVKNAGELQHELVITKPGQTDDEGELAATNKIPPGDQRNLAVELKPGRYQFACFITTTGSDGAVVDHYRSGTHVEVEVTG